MSVESKVRYSVTATLISKEVQDEYIEWLTLGHAQALVERGSALTAEVQVLQGDEFRVTASYVFANQSSYDTYANGLALELRGDGVTRFVDTKKAVKFERSIGEVIFFMKA
jgi:hypothetical protein